MTKPQKIEGEWEEDIEKRMEIVAMLILDDHEHWIKKDWWWVASKDELVAWKALKKRWVEAIRDIVLSATEKAKAEAYRAGLDFQKQSVEMIEKAVRASERQRIVNGLFKPDHRYIVWLDGHELKVLDEASIKIK